jgi:hypothetical protein
MSDFVRFTKNGLIAFDWSPEKREYLPEEPDERGNIVNLRSRCEIEPGTTLGDIFKAVETDFILKSTIAFYSWCAPIDEFHEAAKKPKPEKIDGVKIVELVLEGYAEVHSARKTKKYESKARFESPYLHFGGVGDDGERYSVSCTPMNELADVPVRLVETVEFRKDYSEKPFGEEPLEYCWSLLDVLDAIYYDISFHGGPKENEEFIEMLHDRLDEINKNPDQLVEMKFDDEGEIVWESPDPNSLPGLAS